MLFMRIYRLTPKSCRGYDTYNGAVVVAMSPAEASLIHPMERVSWDGAQWTHMTNLGRVPYCGNDWPHPSKVDVEEIGVAADGLEAGEVILVDFSAG